MHIGVLILLLHMRPLEFIALVVGATLIATLLYSLAALHVPQPEKPIVEYKDFVSILLTAVALVVAVLAMGIAVLAIWGYKEFMNKAHESARGVAAESVNDYLTSPAFSDALAKAAEALQQEQARAAIRPGQTGQSANGQPSSIPPAPTSP